MLTKATLLSYYKRKEVQEVILANSINKEVGVMFGIHSFGKRPNTIEYPGDVIEFVKKGATSFHASEELWSNPLSLSSDLSRKGLNALRMAWDLVLDIDCAILDYSKITAYYVVNALKKEGIRNISCKFSGNKGFHIGLCFESFPVKINKEDTIHLFPEAPRKIAEYLKKLIKEPVAKKILEKDDFSEILKKTKLKKEEIVYYEKNEYGEGVERLNVEPFLNIDTILISSRHLYRMPYSLHEKSGLVSIPVNIKNILDFDKETARPEKVKISEIIFLDRLKSVKDEAKNLFISSFDYSIKEEIKKETYEKINERKNMERDFEEIQEEIQEELFPDCIKKILRGLKDGRKRAVFIIVNFLNSVGWSHDRITQRIKEWNKLNQESLRENYIIGQIRYHKQKKKKILPPNCDNDMYYKDLGVKCVNCKFKNPVSSVRKRIWFLQRQKQENKNKSSSKKTDKDTIKEKEELKEKNK